MNKWEMIREQRIIDAKDLEIETEKQFRST